MCCEFALVLVSLNVLVLQKGVQDTNCVTFLGHRFLIEDDFADTVALILKDSVDGAEDPHCQLWVALDFIQNAEKGTEQLTTLRVFVQNLGALFVLI